jgi:hypothetical protein
MRKIVAVACALLALAGCSNDNQIIINNDAQETITFNFRAVQTEVSPGSSSVIQDIPNGTYTVSLGTYIPAGTTTWSITPSGGEFTFEKKSTKIRAAFGSTFSGGTYAVTWNYSSTDPVGTSPTSP